MPTQSIEQHFSHRIEALISDFTGNTLLFFKGFGIQQIQQLIKHPNSLLDDDSLLHDGLLDFAALDDKWLELATSIKCATKPLVGFYEELLAIRPLLPRIKVDRIVVIENNILSPWVPCCFSYCDAEKLFDYWQTEHEPPAGSFLTQLVQFYGDVKLLTEEKALLLPAAIDDERIVIVPFWRENAVAQEPLTDNIEHIEVNSDRDWEYCLDMTNGRFSPALFLESTTNFSPEQMPSYARQVHLVWTYSLMSLSCIEKKSNITTANSCLCFKNIGATQRIFAPFSFIKIQIDHKKPK